MPPNPVPLLPDVGAFRTVLVNAGVDPDVVDFCLGPLETPPVNPPPGAENPMYVAINRLKDAGIGVVLILEGLQAYFSADLLPQAVPPNRLPLGPRPDGFGGFHVVLGQPPGNHYGIPTARFRNDSGIVFDGVKWALMPARDKVQAVDYTERRRDDDFSSTITWDVPWSIRNGWCEWALGYSSQQAVPKPGDPAHSITFLSRITPSQHPEFPWCYATEAELVNGLGVLVTRDDIPLLDANGVSLLAADGMSDFPIMPAYAEPDYSRGIFKDGIARIRVTYKTLDYDVLTDAQLGVAQAAANVNTEALRYVTRTYNHAFKAIPLPADPRSNMRFVAGPSVGQPVNQGPLLIRPIITLEMLWHDIPNPPFNTMLACVGRVNRTVFDPAGFIPVQPGQGLFQAPKLRRYRSKTGRRTWDITYRVDIDTTTASDGYPGSGGGWNAAPAKDGAFYPIQFLFPDGVTFSGKGLYQTADLNDVFRVELG